MSVTWTNEQRMVIDRRDDNILVSASAGSGKTAVLVRRILAYLTDPEEACDIDRLLVVTFTRAAAAEMKERIGRAIREALEEDPENAHLQRQSSLIHNAQITTIDGFCSWLVRNYCYRTDLEPGFRVGEEGELKLLSADVLEEVLDAGYGTDDPAFGERFRRLAETFATGKSDKALEEAILKVANAAESQPWPGLWVAECRRNNRADNMPVLESLPWMAHFSAGAERKILEGLSLANANLSLAESPEGPSAYLAAAQSYAELFEALAKTIPGTRPDPQKTSSAAAGLSFDPGAPADRGTGAFVSAGLSFDPGASVNREPGAFAPAAGQSGNTYAHRQRLLSEFSPAALGRKKAPAGEIPELREIFKERRAAIDGIRKQLLAMYAFAEEDAVENMRINEEILNTLLDAAELYRARYAEKKRERRLVDFADLEHFALEILRGKPEMTEGGTDASGSAREPLVLGRTEVARELAGRFREVLVDEYQDSNDLQEAILTAVSRIEDGGRNYFCVGDVKQSIYGFRNAHPDLFMQKFALYTPAAEKAGAGRMPETAAEKAGAGRMPEHAAEMPGQETQAGPAAADLSGHKSGPGDPAARPPRALLDHARFISPARRGTRIDLLKNFRSRREVLSATNAIFRQVMVPAAGGVAYGDDAALVYGANGYPEDTGDRFSTELLAVITGEKEEDGEDFLEETGAGAKRELEARAIGERIRRMVRYEEIWDEKAGRMRPAELRDIVILLRTMAGWADTFAGVLESMGIRAYSTARSGYFSATEVALILDYLAIVDNPLQDIPLAAVLHSPIAGLDAEELARVRLVFGSPAADRTLTRKSLWECVREALGERTAAAGRGGGDGIPRSAQDDSGKTPDGGGALSRDTVEKLRVFFSFYEEVRADAPDMPLHELIWKIYGGTGYFDYASALPGGVQRAANLRMLAEKARDYENTSFVGLSSFIRYINNLKRYEVDLAAAGTVGENENAVRIISIHKSKGLEYPVVFVAGLGKAFNRRELTEKLLVDAADGLAADCTDLRRRSVVPTVKKEAVKLHLLQDMVGEELRVLYVALTRARQKLILTGTAADEEAYSEMANLPLPLCAETLGEGYILGAKTPMELIVPAVRRTRQRAELERKREALAESSGEKAASANGGPEESAGAVGQQEKEPGSAGFALIGEVLVKPSELAAEAVASQAEEQNIFERLRQLSPDEVFDPEVRDILEDRLAFRYPYAERTKIPVKVSVSELKKGFAEDEDSAKVYEAPEIIPYVPPFIREREAAEAEETPPAAGGAARGTAFHRVMELLRFGEFAPDDVKDALECEERVRRQIREFVESCRMEEGEAALVNTRDIAAFVRSGLGQRFVRAAKAGKLRREQPFAMEAPAEQIRPDYPPGETILVQGIIDAYFFETNADGREEIVLVDYKTDRVPDLAQLAVRYRLQLDIYAEALQKATGLGIAEKIIWSFCFGRELYV